LTGDGLYTASDKVTTGALLALPWLREKKSTGQAEQLEASMASASPKSA